MYSATGTFISLTTVIAFLGRPYYLSDILTPNRTEPERLFQSNRTEPKRTWTKLQSNGTRTLALTEPNGNRTFVSGFDYHLYYFYDTRSLLRFLSTVVLLRYHFFFNFDKISIRNLQNIAISISILSISKSVKWVVFVIAY